MAGGTSSEGQSQYKESQYSLDVKRDRALLTAAWWNLLGAVRASAPKKELYRLRREYLAVRAGLEGYAAHEVRFTLAQCTREDLKQRGLSTWELGRYHEWDVAVDGPYDPDADYYARERQDANEAERAVESSILPSERSDRILEQGFEVIAAILGGLFKLAGLFFLLWAFIWLIKTLWYLS